MESEEFIQAIKTQPLSEIVDMLHAHPIAINTYTSNGDIAICAAADRGNPAILEALISRGAKLHLKKRGVSALHQACLHGHYDCVQRLLEHNLDVDIRETTGRTPIYHAIIRDHFEIVKLLAESGADIEARSCSRETPLMWAAQHSPASTQYLLECGADVQAKDATGKTPLFYAVEGGQVQCARLLLKAGARIDVQSDHAKTPLLHALTFEHPPMIRFLVTLYPPEALHQALDEELLRFKTTKTETVINGLREAGAESDIPQQQQLHKACIEGDLDKAAELLNSGIDPHSIDRTSGIPLVFYAHQAGHQAIVTKFRQAGADLTELDSYALLLATDFGSLEDLKNVLERPHLNLNIVQQKQHGSTPLMNAVRRNKPAYMAALIAAGADVNFAQDGRTALECIELSNPNAFSIAQQLLEHGASLDKRTSRTLLFNVAYTHFISDAICLNWFELLVAYGVDFNCRLVQEKTVLMICVTTSDRQESVAYLLRQGVAINAVDYQGQTALMHAMSRRGNTDMIRMLLAAGADTTLSDYNGNSTRDHALWSGYSRLFEQLPQ